MSPVLQLLVDGGNHLLLRGPLLDPETAARVFRRLQMPQLGDLLRRPAILPEGYEIVTRAFREDIGAAFVMESGEPHSAAVAELLAELRARNVPIAGDR